MFENENVYFSINASIIGGDLQLNKKKIKKENARFLILEMEITKHTFFLINL